MYDFELFKGVEGELALAVILHKRVKNFEQWPIRIMATQANALKWLAAAAQEQCHSTGTQVAVPPRSCCCCSCKRRAGRTTEGCPRTSADSFRSAALSPRNPCSTHTCTCQQTLQFCCPRQHHFGHISLKLFQQLQCCARARV